MTGFTIGELNKRTGVNSETIRYYEKIGLLPEPRRSAAGYRQYREEHVRRLKFIRRGRALGFGIEDIRALLRLADHRDGDCAEADILTAKHLKEVEQRIEELSRLRDSLRALADCRESAVAQCRVIDTLAG